MLTSCHDNQLGYTTLLSCCDMSAYVYNTLGISNLLPPPHSVGGIIVKKSSCLYLFTLIYRFVRKSSNFEYMV